MVVRHAGQSILNKGIVMYTFESICIGDMFNTKSVRYVKYSETDAIDVTPFSSHPGKIVKIHPKTSIVLLWSCCLEVDK